MQLSGLVKLIQCRENHDLMCKDSYASPFCSHFPTVAVRATLIWIAMYTDSVSVSRHEYRISEVPRTVAGGIQGGAISLPSAVALPRGTGDPGARRFIGAPCVVGMAFKTQAMYKAVLMMN